jgi:hypothetical protein
MHAEPTTGSAVYHVHVNVHLSNYTNVVDIR